jgi:hypothetical protein
MKLTRRFKPGNRPTSLVVVTTLLTLLVSYTQGREWTSVNGKKLEADYAGFDGQEVSLVMTASKRVTVPIKQLSKEDQAWVAFEAPAETPVAGTFGSWLTGKWELRVQDEVPVAVFGGKGLDANKKYPMVFAYVDTGIRERNAPQPPNGAQLVEWVKTFSDLDNYLKRPCIVVAYLANTRSALTLPLSERLLEALPVDTKRVYAVGEGQGGSGAVWLANHTKPYVTACIGAGGAALLGRVPDDGDWKKLYRKCPTWVVIANDGTPFFLESARQAIEELRGLKSFRYTELPSGGDFLAGPLFKDEATHEWLFSQGLGR